MSKMFQRKKKDGVDGEVSKKYEIGPVLGKGQFAVVRLCTKKETGEEFALKIVDKSGMGKDELDGLKTEIEILKTLDHENIIKVYEVFEKSHKTFIVTELVKGGELFDRIKVKDSYSEKDAATLVRKIAVAIKYYHAKRIVHRDLKPENLIYATEDDDSLLKITDFGLAKFRLPQEEMLFSTQCGTPGYVAPEVLYGRQYTSKVDMWSLGVILYILLCGYPPFYADSNAQLYKQIKRSDYSFPAEYWGEVSDLAIDLVKKLLCADEEKRLSAEQVLQHPWLAHGNASRKELGATLEQLERTQARMRLRKGIQTILAVNKFRHMVKQFANNRDVE